MADFSLYFYIFCEEPIADFGHTHTGNYVNSAQYGQFKLA